MNENKIVENGHKKIHDASEMIVEKSLGMTWNEIGAKRGITRQRAHAIVKSYKKRYEVRNIKSIEKIIFPNLKDWLYKNSTTVVELAEKTGIQYSTVMKNFDGTTVMSKTTIDKILELTGETYEYIFQTDDENQKFVD